MFFWLIRTPQAKDSCDHLWEYFKSTYKSTGNFIPFEDRDEAEPEVIETRYSKCVGCGQLRRNVGAKGPKSKVIKL